jgi:hypothetical protein
VKTFDIVFPQGDPDTDVRREYEKAQAFAKVVYETMKEFSVTVKDAPLPKPAQLLQNIIGCIASDVYPPGPERTALTNKVISLLNGVADYTVTTDKNLWYPDPKTPKGGANFNVFNLDPIVWFVHKELNMSSYAFSVDDGQSYFSVGGANTLCVSIGGTKGLPNENRQVLS